MVEERELKKRRSTRNSESEPGPSSTGRRLSKREVELEIDDEEGENDEEEGNDSDEDCE